MGRRDLVRVPWELAMLVLVVVVGLLMWLR
jgi:hypothetical protein